MPNRPTTASPVTFRQSALKQLLMCGKRYEHEYVHGLPTKSSGAQVVGTTFHEAVRKTLDLKTGANVDDFTAFLAGSTDAANGDLYKPDNAGMFFRAGYASAVARAEEEGGFDNVEWHDGKEKELRQAYVAFEDWFTKVAPTLDPKFYELEFKALPVPGLDNVFLEGTIDYGYDEKGVIRLKDWKTAKRAWVQSDVDRDLQATMYCFAYFLLTGRMPLDFTFEVWVKGEEARHLSYPTTRDEGDFDRFTWKLGEWASQVRAGVFPPNTNGWWCSARWCSFHDTCPAGAGVVSLPTAVTSGRSTTPSPSAPAPAPSRVRVPVERKEAVNG